MLNPPSRSPGTAPPIGQVSTREGWSAPQERQELLTKLGPTLESGLQERGFVVLAWSELAPMHVFSSSARPTLAGLQQAKLGAAGAYGWKELLVSWGLKPTILGYPDFLPSLNISNIDSLVWSTSAVYSYQMYNKVPYMSDLVWSTQDQAPVIRSRTWASIPASWRTELLKVAVSFSAKIPTGAVEETNMLAKLSSKGLKVVPFTDTATWYATLEASYATWVRGRIVSTTTFDQARQILADFRASRPTP